LRYVPQNYAEAFTWFRKAADQGNPYAQNHLGLMYYQGQGAPQNYVQAHMWFNLAASNPASNAVHNRDLVAAKMTPVQIAEAQKLASEWKPQFSER